MGVTMARKLMFLSSAKITAETGDIGMVKATLTNDTQATAGKPIGINLASNTPITTMA